MKLISVVQIQNKTEDYKQKITILKQIEMDSQKQPDVEDNGKEGKATLSIAKIQSYLMNSPKTITKTNYNLILELKNDTIKKKRKQKIEKAQFQCSCNYQMSKRLKKHDIKMVVKKLKEYNYQILKYLSAGGEADIFFGVQEGGEIFNLVFRICKMNNGDELKEFEQQFKSFSSNNFNKVKQLQSLTIEESYWDCYLGITIMEYCQQSLADEMREQRLQETFFPLQELICIFSQLLLGLIMLENEQIVHCDIKPPNILKRIDKINNDRHQYVYCDFGVSIKMDKFKNKLQKSIGFTRSYCAPEQCATEQCVSYVNYSSDIYSLGKTFQQIIDHTINQIKKQNLQEASFFSNQRIYKYHEILKELKIFIQENMIQEKQGNRKHSIFLMEYLIYKVSTLDLDLQSILQDQIFNSTINCDSQEIFNLFNISKLFIDLKQQDNPILIQFLSYSMRAEQFVKDAIYDYDKEIFRVYEDDLFKNKVFVNKIDNSFSFFYTIGKYHLLRSENQDALNCFEKALEILQMQEYSLDKYYSISYILDNIGDCHFYLGEIIKFQKKYFDELNEISAFCLTQISNPRLIFIFLNLAKCLTIIGDFDQAIEFYYQASYAFLQVYDDDQSKLNYSFSKAKDQSQSNISPHKTQDKSQDQSQLNLSSHNIQDQSQFNLSQQKTSHKTQHQSQLSLNSQKTQQKSQLNLSLNKIEDKQQLNIIQDKSQLNLSSQKTKHQSQLNLSLNKTEDKQQLNMIQDKSQLNLSLNQDLYYQKLYFDNFNPQDQSIHNEISIKVIDFFRKKKFKKEWNIILLKSFCHLALLYLYKGKEIQFGFKLIEQICEIIETLDQQNIILRMIAFETKASFYSYFEQYDQEIEQYSKIMKDLTSFDLTELQTDNKYKNVNQMWNINYHIGRTTIKILNCNQKVGNREQEIIYQKSLELRKLNYKRYPNLQISKAIYLGNYNLQYLHTDQDCFKQFPQDTNHLLCYNKVNYSLEYYVIKGDLLEQNGNFEGQLKEQQFVLQKRKNLYPSDHFCVVQSLGRVGRSYKNISNFKQAIDYFKQQKKMYKRITKQSKEGLSQFVFIYESEFPYFTLEREFMNQQNRPLQLADCYLHLAACELENKQHSTCIKYFKKATQLYKNATQVGYYSKLHSFYLIGEYYFEKNEPAEAIEAFIKAYDFKYDNLNHLLTTRTILIQIIKCSIQLKDKQNEQKYLQLLFQNQKKEYELEIEQREIIDYENKMAYYLKEINLLENNKENLAETIQTSLNLIEQLYQRMSSSNNKFMVKQNIFEGIKKFSEFNMTFTNKLLQDMSESYELCQDKDKSAPFFLLLAQSYQYINQFENSLKLCSQSIEIQISLNKRCSPVVLNSIIYIVEVINSIKDSQSKSDLNEKYQEKLSSYFSEIQDENARACCEIGQIFQNGNNLSSAVHFYKQSIEITLKLPSLKKDKDISSIISQIGYCYRILADKESFQYYFNKYMDIFQEGEFIFSDEQIQQILAIATKDLQ